MLFYSSCRLPPCRSCITAIQANPLLLTTYGAFLLKVVVSLCQTTQCLAIVWAGSPTTSKVMLVSKDVLVLMTYSFPQFGHLLPITHQGESGFIVPTVLSGVLNLCSSRGTYTLQTLNHFLLLQPQSSSLPFRTSTCYGCFLQIYLVKAISKPIKLNLQQQTKSRRARPGKS